MVYVLPGLHDLDDGSLHLELSIGSQVLDKLGFSTLVRCLRAGNRNGNFDESIAESKVDGELVCADDLLALWLFFQKLKLDEHGHEVILERLFWYHEPVYHLLEGNSVFFVEERHQKHLVGRHVQLINFGFTAFVEADARADFGVSLAQLECQLATRKFVPVVFGEN